MGLVKFLQNLAGQVQGGFALGIHVSQIVDAAKHLQSFSEEDSQAYGQFLSNVLQAIMTSGLQVMMARGGDVQKAYPLMKQKVYPLLKENTDKLDDRLAELLWVWATTILEEAKLDEAKYLAAVIVEFSNLIQQFPLGNKASNMEIVITGYEVALTVYTRDTFPYEWATMQNNCGQAYHNRIRGNKAENLERAIACLQEALKVYTFDAFPYEWANTQNNLAATYLYRIRGERTKNLEQTIACCQEALKVRTVEAFPADWAMVQNNLAIAYAERIRGERAENLDRAITCYQNALKVYTFDAFPYEWARTQNNLAIAYHNRIRGNKAKNLERAIACYQNALKIRTFDAFPYEWANTQNNLATAYSDSIGVDKAENLERAIACLQEALKVYTFDAFPYKWARAQNNLAIGYRNRIRGDKAENLERAIICYQNTLKVYNTNTFPIDWAQTQNNLAVAYADRIKGDKAENIEQKIACLQEALKIRTFEAFPKDWAQVQINLGIAYRNRIRGDKAENIEQAIACLQEALKVYTFDAFPVDWAMTKNNLANAYGDRIREDEAENLELAIACLQEVLTFRTFEAFPIGWATTQNNLASIYLKRIRGDKAENLEQAISCLQKALKVYTFEDFPYEWANRQNNLGVAYYLRIKGEWAKNLEQAIIAYKKALTVRNREAFPQEHAETLWVLGVAYQNTNQLTSAYSNFESAIATVESLREEIVSGEESKRKQAEDFQPIYSCMVEVCLKLSKITEAIEYVERSKTRNLVELILNRDLKTIFPPGVVTQLETYRDEIATGQYQIQHSKAENPKFLAQRLQQLRQQRNELQNRYFPVGYGFKFDQFQLTLDQRTAIIEWYITDEKILAFVVSGQELTVWQSQPEDLESLSNWENEYLQDYNKTGKNQWRDKLDERLNKLSEILHLESILDQIPEEQYDRLILIPHRFLHLLPLHALPVGELYLLDRFPQGVGYAPSCQLLQQVQQRERPDFQSLFAVQNPTEDLQFTDQEVNSILSLFPSHQVLSNSQATKAALEAATSHLKEVDYLHFSCHGSFNPDSPFLLLADAIVSSIPANADPKQYLATDHGFIDLSKCLTLGNLFERGFDLNKCRLVVLSACETGWIDVGNNSDEYIGLPSGFLYAGSSSVVSSLWTVDDMSTAYLMIKFLQNLKAAFDGGKDVSVAVALNQAQHWLRNITWEDLEKWANDLQLDPEIKREILDEIERSIRKIQPQKSREARRKNPRYEKIDKKPFQSPYHWAYLAVGGG